MCSEGYCRGKSKDEREQRACCHLKQGSQNKLLWRDLCRGKNVQTERWAQSWLEVQVKWSWWVSDFSPSTRPVTARGCEIWEAVGSSLPHRHSWASSGRHPQNAVPWDYHPSRWSPGQLVGTEVTKAVISVSGQLYLLAIFHLFVCFARVI